VRYSCWEAFTSSDSNFEVTLKTVNSSLRGRGRRRTSDQVDGCRAPRIRVDWSQFRKLTDLSLNFVEEATNFVDEVWGKRADQSYIRVQVPLLAVWRLNPFDFTCELMSGSRGQWSQMNANPPVQKI